MMCKLSEDLKNKTKKTTTFFSRQGVQHLSYEEKNQLIFPQVAAAQLHLGENIRQTMSGHDTDFGSPQQLLLVTLLCATSPFSDKTHNTVQNWKAQH